MKKLFTMAMVGAMVLGTQSMVFANNTATNEMVKSVPAIEVNGEKVVQENHEGEIKAAVLTEAIEMTEEEKKAADFKKVEEICEALNIQYDENTTIDQLFATLTEEQFNKLVELEIIQEAAVTEEATEAIGMEEATVIEMEAMPVASIASQN